MLNLRTSQIDLRFALLFAQGGENSEIVRTINTLAHNLGMDVVAEGVETAEQVAQLKSMKCTLGQGYFFSRPLDASAAQAFIETRASYIPSALINESLIQTQFNLLN